MRTLDLHIGVRIPGDARNFDGATSFIELPSDDFASFPSTGTIVANFSTSIAVWFKTSSAGVILGQSAPASPGDENLYYSAAWIPWLYIDTNGYLRAKLFNQLDGQQVVSPTVLNDNNWHYAVLTLGTNAMDNPTGSVETLYVDGRVIGSESAAVPDAFSSAYSFYLGTGYVGPWFDNWPATNSESTGWFYFSGALDEVEISSIARSGGWVQAEYNNQSSPSTFFAFSPEAGSAGNLNPLSVTLYQSQAQQFTVLETGMCNGGGAVWSMPAGSPGTMSPAGLYTAPVTIDAQQTVTVTATTLGANSAPLSATITLMPPVAVTVSPGVASLPTGGAQQFTATVVNATNTAVTWTINPVGVGSISASGLYTAPATLNGQQTVSIIATSLADQTQSASATVTLGVLVPLAPVVTVNPQAEILYAGETQQFSATVTNTGNTAVTWSIGPAGAGSIDNAGLYTAPATITAQQTVIIVATSQSNSAVTATATVSLTPTQCISNGYSFTRAITIDHTKIPNTDQANFPFLFSVTDPRLATAANGGHVANPNGYDLIFTSDPAGQIPLNYEMEQYNPATGQVIAWVQIPDLSHASDTVIYLFYGNPNISASQQNPTAVWDSNYGGVWHLGGMERQSRLQILRQTGTTVRSRVPLHPHRHKLVTV
jgi:Concanavalin A-like lectin/glucanases superfamily/Domain of unknown function (DUF2341)